MPVIKTTDFGGLFPSVPERALVENAAQTAHNLTPRVVDFRPLMADVTAASVPVSNPKTLHRMARSSSGGLNTAMSGGWIAHAGVVNYVKGQINDEATERTYYTFGDGSQPPRVMDARGADRQLGVPMPGAKPGVEALVTDELTVEEMVDNAPEDKVYAAVKAAITPNWIGADHNTTGAGGFRDRETLPGLAGEDAGMYQVRYFPLTGPTGQIVATGTSKPPEFYNWMLDASLGGSKIQGDDGNWYFYINIPAYGRAYAASEATLRTALQAVKKPGTDGEQWFPDDYIDSVAAGLAAGLNLLGPEVKPSLDAMRTAFQQVVSIIEGDSAPLTATSYVNFYAKPNVSQIITNAIANAANIAFDVAVTFADGQPSIVSPLYGEGTANRAYAVANMTAAINSRYAAGSDGVKRLDEGSLNLYIKDAMLAVANSMAPEKKAATLVMLSGFDPSAYTAELARQIGPSGLGVLSDWPGSATGSVAGQSKVATLKAAIAAANTASKSLTAIYDRVFSKSYLTDVVAENMQDLSFVETVERITDTRFYVYTYVTDWGEESAPSPVSDLVEVDQNDAVNVSVGAPADGRNIVGWRLYRSNTGSQASAFQLVADRDAPNAKVTDDVFDYFELSSLIYEDKIKSSALAEVCPSTTWLEPPETLSGLVGMPNGILAGFFDNTVAFCEAYYHYAWPVEYQITCEFPVVALGVFGQTLVVAHHGGVNYISGADSASMSMQKNVSLQACVAPRSMVTAETGVVFAGPDGLCLATSQGVSVITINHFTRDDWQKLNPTTIVGAYHEFTYYFMCDAESGPVCYALHLETGKLTTVGVNGSTFYQDVLTDRLYVAQGSNVAALFAGTTPRQATRRTKKFVAPMHSAFAWVCVESNFEAGPVVVHWYGDGQLRHSATVSSREPVRLPAGRYLEHEFELVSSSRVNAVTIASSGTELRGS